MTIGQAEIKQAKIRQEQMEPGENKTEILPSIQQIVLKLTHPPATFCLNSEPIAPSVLAAMQRLVAIVTQLRSPLNNEAVNQPHTPETLSLYVFEEAQDVLEAWQKADQAGTDQARTDQTRTTSDQVLFNNQLGNQPIAALGSAIQPTWQGYFELQQLASWLLWGTARSSHTVMRLMEGKPTKYLQLDQSWQTGILRLVPLLSLYTTSAIHTIDLATEQSFSGTLGFPNALAADRTIQVDLDSPDSALSSQAMVVTELIRTISQQIRSTTPAIVPFLEGTSTEFLMPHFAWQTGSIRLHYELEFIPFPSVSSPILADPLIQFTNPVWLKQHQALISEQQTVSTLSELANLPSGDLSDGDLSSVKPVLLSLPTLVAHACQLSDRWQTGWAIASRRFVTQKLSVNELAVRLHWCLIHSAYEVMQLMSGISVTLLSPHAPYQTGTLRFLMALKIQTPELEWVLDLATTEILASRSPLPADAIVQSATIQWCRQPSLLGHLEAIFWQRIHSAIPEVKLLLQGAEIDLLANDPLETGDLDKNQAWQPGIIQLQGGFQFVPSSTAIGAI